MKNYRITFYNKDLQCKSSQDRLQKIVKPIFWSEDVEDWRYFNNELKIEAMEPFGCRDAAILAIETGENEEMWTREIINGLKSNKDVFRIEIKNKAQWEEI